MTYGIICCKTMPLQERSIKYGFTIAATELLNTIPTLWNATLSFMAQAQHLVAEDNLLSFVTGLGNPLSPVYKCDSCFRGTVIDLDITWWWGNATWASWSERDTIHADLLSIARTPVHCIT